MRYSPEVRRGMEIEATGDRKLRKVSEGNLISIVDLTYYDGVSKIGILIMGKQKIDKLTVQRRGL